MKQPRLLITAMLAMVVLCSTSYAADALNKKLIKPLNTPVLPVQNAPMSNPTVEINSATGKPVTDNTRSSHGVVGANTEVGKTNAGVLSPANTERVPLGQIDPCPNSICITSINGKRIANVVFTPGKHYLIAGKHFGAAQNGAKVMINIDGTTAVPLAINSWSDSLIDAVFEISFKGKEDSDNTAFWIDFPSMPRVSMGEGLRGKFVANREKQTISFKSIPKQAFVYETGEFGEPNLTDVGYYFVRGTESANQTIDSIKHQFTDKLKLSFIKPSFKLVDVHAEFGPTNTNGSRCEGCGAGSGGVYVYGAYGWEIKNTELVINRAVWHNHTSPGWGFFTNKYSHYSGNGVKIFDKSKGSNYFLSDVEKLELVVDGPAGVSPIK